MNYYITVKRRYCRNKLGINKKAETSIILATIYVAAISRLYKATTTTTIITNTAMSATTVLEPTKITTPTPATTTTRKSIIVMATSKPKPMKVQAPMRYPG